MYHGDADSAVPCYGSYDATPLSASQVCWIDQLLQLGDLWSEAPSLRRLRSRLELLYPELPLTGNVMLHCPEGWTDGSSPVSVGIAVEGRVAILDGYVFRPLRTAGQLTAAYRGAFQIADLADAAQRFQILRASEGNAPGKGLVVEVDGLGRRSGDGTRLIFRAGTD